MNTCSAFRRIAFAIVVGEISAAAALAGDSAVFLGPGNPGAENGLAGWYEGTLGGGSVSADNDDPAKGYRNFRIGITNAASYPENHADLRSEQFSLGKARGPFTFSFTYKLPDKVKSGEDIDVDFRFFGPGEDNFLGQEVLNVGSSSGDSEMTQYKTITVSNIFAPSGAVKADVWIVAGIAEPWSSGYAQFDDFSVTAVPVRAWARVFISIAFVAALSTLMIWALYVRRRRNERMAV